MKNWRLYLLIYALLAVGIVTIPLQRDMDWGDGLRFGVIFGMMIAPLFGIDLMGWIRHWKHND